MFSDRRALGKPDARRARRLWHLRITYRNLRVMQGYLLAANKNELSRSATAHVYGEESVNRKIWCAFMGF